MKHKFTIELKPRGKKNSRPIFINKKTGKHFLGKDKDLVSYENDALMLLKFQKNAQGIKLPYECKMKGRFIFRFAGKTLLDVDNGLNMALDLLQKAEIIKNDRQIKFIDHLAILEETGLPDQTTIYLDPMA